MKPPANASTANTRACSGPGKLPIIACSRVVIGPDSLGSVESVPVSAASSSDGSQPVSASTAAASAMTIKIVT
ncbi:hypothetical protein GCM10009838_68200 [Catenulispora subtropica]|uniref:Uncharacterized protein n=1 Tax=Catenulispora subtropica TaxID=450798 RepID=A0ABN2SXG4_9ACTN